jgi:hypothetical protein
MTFNEARKSIILQQMYVSIDVDLDITRKSTIKAKVDYLAREKALTDISYYQKKAADTFDKYVSLITEKETDDKIYEANNSFIFYQKEAISAFDRYSALFD